MASSEFPPSTEPRSPTAPNEVRHAIIQRAHDSKDAAADQLLAAAERIRAEALKTEDGTVYTQAQQLSRGLERAAVYLHGHTLDQMTDDATELVQSRPWQAVLIAFLVGVIFARSFARGR